MSDKFYDLLDDAPEYCNAVARLFRWGENFCGFQNPCAVFCDLIGFSMDEFGTNLSESAEYGCSLGYLDLDMIADALKEYAKRPQDVQAYVKALRDSETDVSDKLEYFRAKIEA